MKLALLLALLIVASASGGVASFYGPEAQGKLMANGQPFDFRQMTAASYFYPLGTKVRVTCKRTGRFVVVTITDRGPARRLRREIDLSKAAFAMLADPRVGLLQVSVREEFDIRVESVPTVPVTVQNGAITVTLPPDVETVTLRFYYGPQRLVPSFRPKTK